MTDERPRSVLRDDGSVVTFTATGQRFETPAWLVAEIRGVLAWERAAADPRFTAMVEEGLAQAARGETVAWSEIRARLDEPTDQEATLADLREALAVADGTKQVTFAVTRQAIVRQRLRSAIARLAGPCPRCGWDETSSDVHAEDCGR